MGLILLLDFYIFLSNRIYVICLIFSPIGRFTLLDILLVFLKNFFHVE